MRNARMLCAVPLACVVLACGEAIDPVTGGEGSGSERFGVLLTDDPGNEDATLQGTMTGSIRVSLRNDAGALVSLGVANDVELPLHDGDTVRLEGLSRPPIDDYTTVQLRFEGVDVEVEAGSQVGDSTLANNVTLDVGGTGAASVDVLVPVFSVDNSSVMEIVIDLNSESWVTGTNLDNQVVSQADLANSVLVEVN